MYPSWPSIDSLAIEDIIQNMKAMGGHMYANAVRFCLKGIDSHHSPVKSLKVEKFRGLFQGEVVQGLKLTRTAYLQYMYDSD